MRAIAQAVDWGESLLHAIWRRVSFQCLRLAAEHGVSDWMICGARNGRPAIAVALIASSRKANAPVFFAPLERLVGRAAARRVAHLAVAPLEAGEPMQPRHVAVSATDFLASYCLGGTDFLEPERRLEEVHFLRDDVADWRSRYARGDATFGWANYNWLLAGRSGDDLGFDPLQRALESAERLDAARGRLATGQLWRLRPRGGVCGVVGIGALDEHHGADAMIAHVWLLGAESRLVTPHAAVGATWLNKAVDEHLGGGATPPDGFSEALASWRAEDATDDDPMTRGSLFAFLRLARMCGRRATAEGRAAPQAKPSSSSGASGR